MSFIVRIVEKILCVTAILQKQCWQKCFLSKKINNLTKKKIKMNPRLRQLLRQDLKTIINDCVDYELPAITGKTDIQKDLGFDSLDVVELLIDIEKQYQVSISNEQFETVRTFDELVKLLIKVVK